MNPDALEAKQIESAAPEAQQYPARLIDSSPDAIISADKDGNVVLFSEKAEDLFGYRAKEIIGQNISVLYGDAAGARQVALEMRKRPARKGNLCVGWITARSMRCRSIANWPELRWQTGRERKSIWPWTPVVYGIVL